jgi:hypothetical protein
MVFLVLSRRCLVALQAVDALLRVPAHFVFMNDGVLRAFVTLGAFPRGANQFTPGLASLDRRGRAIHEECGYDEAERNDNGCED